MVYANFCPKCGAAMEKAKYYPWQIVVSIFFFPIGLMALAAPKKPATCTACQYGLPSDTTCEQVIKQDEEKAR